MKNTKEELGRSIEIAILAQHGSTGHAEARKEKGLAPEEPVDLWIERDGGYTVVTLYQGNTGMASIVAGPPPTGALILKVSKQP